MTRVTDRDMIEFWNNVRNCVMRNKRDRSFIKCPLGSEGEEVHRERRKEEGRGSEALGREANVGKSSWCRNS